MSACPAATAGARLAANDFDQSDEADGVEITGVHKRLRKAAQPEALTETLTDALVDSESEAERSPTETTGVHRRLKDLALPEPLAEERVAEVLAETDSGVATETLESQLARPEAPTTREGAPPPRPQLTAKEIREYMPMVHHMVSRLLGKIPVNVLREDLIAAGAFGLVTSMLRDGPERSPTFEWYARIRIRGAIMDELRNQDWLTRRARMHVHSTYGDPLPSERSSFVGFDDLPGGVQSLAAYQDEPPSPLELMEAEHDRRLLGEAMDGLPERERYILTMHYFRGVQFKALAEELGVSMPRISQLHSRAVSKLRQALEAARDAS